MTLGRGLAFFAGYALVVLALVGWAVPRGTGHAGADVAVISQAVGELSVQPTGAFVNAVGMEPGSDASGGFGIVNQTSKTLRIRLRALPDARDLDRVLKIEIRAGGLVLYRGDLGGLRPWTRSSLVLASGRNSAFSARIWIPAATTTGYQGQSESVPLELQAVPVEGSHE